MSERTQPAAEPTNTIPAIERTSSWKKPIAIAAGVATIVGAAIVGPKIFAEDRADVISAGASTEQPLNPTSSETLASEAFVYPETISADTKPEEAIQLMFESVEGAYNNAPNWFITPQQEYEAYQEEVMSRIFSPEYIARETAYIAEFKEYMTEYSNGAIDPKNYAHGYTEKFTPNSDVVTSSENGAVLIEQTGTSQQSYTYPLDLGGEKWEASSNASMRLIQAPDVTDPTKMAWYIH